MIWSFLVRFAMQRPSPKAAVKGFKNNKKPRLLPMQHSRSIRLSPGGQLAYLKYYSNSKALIPCISSAFRSSNSVSSTLFWCVSGRDRHYGLVQSGIGNSTFVYACSTL